MTGGNPMKKNITRIILALMLFLTLSGCAGLSNYSDSTDYDDGFIIMERVNMTGLIGIRDD
jgi:hypothetical protein